MGDRGAQGPAKVSLSPGCNISHDGRRPSALTLEDGSRWSQPLRLRPSSPPVCTKPATPFCSSRHDHGPPALASSVPIPVGWMGALSNRAVLFLGCFPTRPQDQQGGRLTTRLPSERTREQTTPRKGCVRVSLDLWTKGRRTAGKKELGGRWGPHRRRPSCRAGARAEGGARQVPLRVRGRERPAKLCPRPVCPGPSQSWDPRVLGSLRLPRHRQNPVRPEAQDLQRLGQPMGLAGAADPRLTFCMAAHRMPLPW